MLQALTRRTIAVQVRGSHDTSPGIASDIYRKKRDGVENAGRLGHWSQWGHGSLRSATQEEGIVLKEDYFGGESVGEMAETIVPESKHLESGRGADRLPQGVPERSVERLVR